MKALRGELGMTSFWDVNVDTVSEFLAVAIAIVALAVSVWVAARGAKERAAYEVRRRLRTLLIDARSVVAELYSAHALQGIGPHLETVLARFDKPPTWDMIDKGLSKGTKMEEIAVREAWLSSPAAVPLIEAAVSLRRNAQALGGGLAFLQPAATLLFQMGTGQSAPSFREPTKLDEPPEGKPVLNVHLFGPLSYLALQLEMKECREFFDVDLVLALRNQIPVNAAIAFVGGGQHEASMWLLRLIEIAVSEIERLPTSKLMKLAAAPVLGDRPNTEMGENKEMGELMQGLGPLQKLKPELAGRLKEHAQVVAEGLSYSS